jgi:hypothetical protein
MGDRNGNPARDLANAERNLTALANGDRITRFAMRRVIAHTNNLNA